MIKKILLASALSCCALLSVPTHANTITTLFNTGVDDSRTVLANNATENHYKLVSVPMGTTNLRVATAINGFPISPWIADDALSGWIGPNSNNELDGPVGYYDYQVSFSLNGFNPATAALTGSWAADDVGTDIVLNGLSTGAYTSGGYQSFTTFNINSGFVAGLNTLDFKVYNYGGPTGLRVEVTGTADVPEPGTMAILGAGLSGLGLIRRRSA